MRGSTTMRRAVLLVAAVAVAALAVAGVRFLTPGARPPPAPPRPDAQVEPGRVVLTWAAVAGADQYLLIRDDQVVYAGSATRGVDATVTKGKHRYRVQASRNGVPSRMGEAVTVQAGEGWGVAAPLVNLLPRLLPPAPRTTGGWQTIRCNWQIKPGQNELGPAEHGAGIVGMRYRLICGSRDDLRWGLHAMWFYSKDAVDGYLSRIIPKASTFRWNHGTGFYNPVKSEGYLKFDDPKLSLIVLGIYRSDAKSAAAVRQMADSLPI